MVNSDKLKLVVMTLVIFPSRKTKNSALYSLFWFN